MIIALAGRRIDVPDAETPGFPLAAVPVVRERVRKLLDEQQATVLVASAACGADLVALEEAGALGLRRRVLLPFAAERFRQTSVVDRPGDWGPIYDRVLAEVEERGDLLILDGSGDEQCYAAANSAILNEAIALAQSAGERAVAAIVWDARSRGPEDLTQAFLEEARSRDLPVIEISTTVGE